MNIGKGSNNNRQRDLIRFCILFVHYARLFLRLGILVPLNRFECVYVFACMDKGLTTRCTEQEQPHDQLHPVKSLPVPTTCPNAFVLAGKGNISCGFGSTSDRRRGTEMTVTLDLLLDKFIVPAPPDSSAVHCGCILLKCIGILGDFCSTYESHYLIQL
jgi:hypothetical protein